MNPVRNPVSNPVPRRNLATCPRCGACRNPKEALRQANRLYQRRSRARRKAGRS